ncbi:hypothetical protein ScPMuIL_004907 [Solemya velum]
METWDQRIEAKRGMNTSWIPSSRHSWQITHCTSNYRQTPQILQLAIKKSLVGKHIVEKQLREALDLKWGYWERMSLLHQEPVPRFRDMSDEAKESVKTYYMTGDWEVHSLSKPKRARKEETVDESDCVKKHRRGVNKPKRVKRQKRRQKREDAPVSVERQKGEDAPASEKQQKRADKSANVKRGVTDGVLSCSTYQELKIITKDMEIEEIPDMDSKTFCNTGKVIDKTSFNLVPNDIPLKPTSQLYPATIYGDGNRLPRADSFLAYGHEINHLELKKRITIELTKNENLYLNNEVMKKGRNPQREDDVVKAFAHYSSCYMAERLTTRNIRSVFQREVLQVRKAGTWMGLWQIALDRFLRRGMTAVQVLFQALQMLDVMSRRAS